jgi:hypothetical protein
MPETRLIFTRAMETHISQASVISVAFVRCFLFSERQCAVKIRSRGLDYFTPVTLIVVGVNFATLFVLGLLVRSITKRLISR